MEAVELFRVTDRWTEGRARHFADPVQASRYAGRLRALRDTSSPGRLEVKRLTIRDKRDLLGALDSAAGWTDLGPS